MLALRFTTESVREQSVDSSWSPAPGYALSEPLIYGQRKQQGQTPIVVNGNEPFAYFSWRVIQPDSAELWMTYYLITDPKTLSIERLGVMDLADGKLDKVGISQSTLSPDIDGDGLLEILVSYTAWNVTTGLHERVTDAFLSTGRTVSSISQEQLQLMNITARRTPEGWLIRDLGSCRSVLTHSPIYALNGSLIALADTRRVDSDCLILRHQISNVNPLFAVIGSCVIRIQ